MMLALADGQTYSHRDLAADQCANDFAMEAAV
jgi:hypothetical protein